MEKITQKKAVVIGAGFGGISTSGYLALDGWEVTLLEKNSWVGGRAQVWEHAGYRFDMGPSWYLLIDEHEKWFRDMGAERSDYYSITKLDPQYKVFFNKEEVYTLPGTTEGAARVFESIEQGAGAKLIRYLQVAKKKHDVSIEHFIYSNFDSFGAMMKPSIAVNALSLGLLDTYHGVIKRWFSNPKLQAILEYPTVFLGASAKTLPGVYTLMNWVDFGQGAFYPQGGFGRVVESMAEVVVSKGVEIKTNSEVSKILVENGVATGVELSGGEIIEADLVVAAADYHFVDRQLLPPEYSYKSEEKWDDLALAPSCINFYIGVKKQLPELEHHTFFFDSDWDSNFDHVYTSKKLHDKPLFYVHMPSVTDTTTAPKGCSALFILIPIAAGIKVSEESKSQFLEACLSRIEQLTGSNFQDDIEFVRSYTVGDFEKDYNAYKGNAFGLGHTLLQTAVFRPPNKSPHISNLYYAGQYTLPGTGTSMAMIGGKVTASRIAKEYPTNH